MEEILQKLAVTHVPTLNRNMTVFCRKCNKKFIKQTAQTTLCEACWNKSRLHVGNDAGTKRYCSMCQEVIKADAKRISICEISRDGSKKINPYVQKRIALYHKDCWAEKITPILNKFKIIK